MRSFFLFFIWISGSFLSAQTFYEKIMEINTANADTSNDYTVLEISAKAMERVSRGTTHNWDAAFYIGLCYVRITDLLILKKDTLGARSALLQSTKNLKKADTLNPGHIENKILAYYHQINELRLSKTDPKKIKLVEIQLENCKNNNAMNPRIYIVYAYFYKCFYLANKTKRKKALDLLREANKLLEEENAKGIKPLWGKKWMNELSNEISLKVSPAKVR